MLSRHSVANFAHVWWGALFEHLENQQVSVFHASMATLLF